MTTRTAIFHRILAITSLLLTSCASSKLSNVQDAPVTDITLAEPFVAEAQVANKVRRLRADPSKKQELAAALAEISMLHRDWIYVVSATDPVEATGEADSEAKEAAQIIDPADKRSHAYFLTRRALFFAMNAHGLHGARIIEPLLHGNYSDLEKAQIYNDLANLAPVGEKFRDYSVKALALRAKAAGPHSLEVAESLITFSNRSLGGRIDKELCSLLQLPPVVASIEKDSTGDSYCEPQNDRDRADMNNRRDIFLRRAAQIQEDILGSSSLRLAETLSALSEDDQLRALAIYQRQLGSENPLVMMTYESLATTTKDPLKAREYRRKASVGSALHRAGSDLFQRGYVSLNSVLPENLRLDRQEALAKVFKTFHVEPPVIDGTLSVCDGIGWRLDTKKLGVPEIEELTADSSTSFDSYLFRDRLFLNGYKKDGTHLRMYLPTWGGHRGTEETIIRPDGMNVMTDGTEVEVIGKGRIRFRQKGVDGQGYQEVEYKWNGRTFEEVRGKPGDQDAKIIRTAIDEAVNGVRSYGLRGHHAVDHELIGKALYRSNAAAQELFKNGRAYGAANRLRIMFELTSDLVQEASTGVPVESEIDDSKDDVHKWIQAWSYNGPQCHVGLTAREWRPYLDNYSYFLEKAGELERARKVRSRAAMSR